MHRTPGATKMDLYIDIIIWKLFFHGNQERQWFVLRENQELPLWLDWSSMKWIFVDCAYGAYYREVRSPKRNVGST